MVSSTVIYAESEVTLPEASVAVTATALPEPVREPPYARFT
jgi:hypothetical protein